MFIGDKFMMNYIITTGLISFPEALIVFLLGLSLCNIKIDYSKLLGMALLQSIVAFLVKSLNIHMGLHTIVQIISMYLLIIIFLKMKYYKAIIPVLVGSFVQGIIQITVISIINLIYAIDPTKLNTDFQSAFTVFIPVFLVSIIILKVIRQSHFVLCEI
jgi:hypothetical protein